MHKRGPVGPAKRGAAATGGAPSHCGGACRSDGAWGAPREGIRAVMSAGNATTSAPTPAPPPAPGGFPKMSELLAARDRCQPSEALMSAIRNVLSPPTLVKRPNASVTSTLNKLAPQSFEKLAPSVLVAAAAAPQLTVDTLLTFTIKQNAYYALYVDLLGRVGAASQEARAVVDDGAERYCRETLHLVQGANEALLLPATTTDEYDEFCDAMQKKKQLIARGRTLALMHKAGIAKNVRGVVEALCAQLTGYGDGAAARNDFATETLIDCVGELRGMMQAGELRSACQSLLARPGLSFKMRFKVEGAMAAAK